MRSQVWAASSTSLDFQISSGGEEQTGRVDSLRLLRDISQGGLRGKVSAVHVKVLRVDNIFDGVRKVAALGIIADDCFQSAIASGPGVFHCSD
jgi:hypothetical protein